MKIENFEFYDDFPRFYHTIRTDDGKYGWPGLVVVCYIQRLYDNKYWKQSTHTWESSSQENSMAEIGTTGIYSLSTHADFISSTAAENDSGFLVTYYAENSGTPAHDAYEFIYIMSGRPAKTGDAMTLTSAYDKAKDDVLTPLDVVDGIVDAIKAKTDLQLDAQDIRDAMKLAPSAGDPASGSVDAVLDSLYGSAGLILSDTNAIKGDVDDIPGINDNVIDIKAKLTTLIIRSGTAQGGATGYIQLDSEASEETDFYKELVVVLTGGTGVGQVRQITGYNGGTKRASVGAKEFLIAPDNTTTFEVVAAYIPTDMALDSTVAKDATVAKAGGTKGTDNIHDDLVNLDSYTKGMGGVIDTLVTSVGNLMTKTSLVTNLKLVMNWLRRPYKDDIIE